MKKKCTICGKRFLGSRPWSKYCSEKCKKKANSLRVIKHRKKHEPLQIKTVKELKTKNPYNNNYEAIMKAITSFYKLDDKTRKEIKSFADREDLRHFGPEPHPKTKERIIESYEKRISKQTVGWSYLQKETKLSNETLSKYISVMRKLGLLEESSYSLCEKYKFDPLKVWSKDMILNTSAYNILPNRNLTIFSPTISERKMIKGNGTQLKNGMESLIDGYGWINLHFRKIGLREAGRIWDKAVSSLNVSQQTKFYVWLRLVALHYLATLNYANAYDCHERGEIPHVDFDIVAIMKNRDFEPPFHLKFHRRKINEDFQRRLIAVCEKAFDRYVKSIIPSFDRKRLDDDLKKNRKKILKIYHDTLSCRAQAENFIIVIHPEYLPLYGGDIEVFEASLRGYEKEEKTERLEEPKIYPSFFDITHFFEGLIEELLGMSSDSKMLSDVEYHYFCEEEQFFYRELRMLANAFEVPSI